MASRNDKYAKMDNEYIRAKELQKAKQKKQKKLVLRRVFFFFCLPFIVIVWFISTVVNQSTMIEEKQAMLDEAKANLKNVEKQQELLEMQITQYEDDEYIAKILRKEYLLSEDGEIIFVMPEDALEEENENDK
ncbi:MAG TPA: septum formation initiator family protein [Metalysinibacillus jejuensis]|uniref:Septum formation initiator family protein n=1 Tax=Metalysinibacillus jejuensis TaxID=914327 RepID=A0A921N935_9BACL|nr:septum formation initiator family protein [Metalysinibacillus jejuensis]